MNIHVRCSLLVFMNCIKVVYCYNVNLWTSRLIFMNWVKWKLCYRKWVSLQLQSILLLKKSLPLIIDQSSFYMYVTVKSNR